MMYSIKILRVFSNPREKQPALRFLKVQAAFYRERSSENYFSGSFNITSDMRISLGHDPSYVCCRLDYGMVWNNSVTTKPRACVPHTPYTLILRFASPAGRVCGVATHVVSGNAGYGLLMPAQPCYKSGSPPNISSAKALAFSKPSGVR